MASEIRIGDYVGILEGTEKGYVIKIEKNKVWIETDDGFEITAFVNKLVKYPFKKKKIISSVKPDSAIPENKEAPKEFPAEKKPVIKKVIDRSFKVNPSYIGEEKKHISKKRQENIWEVDLHIEELTDDYKHLSNGEIVDMQLRHARFTIEKAVTNKISKVVFIHGKGKGTLRQELHHLLAGYTYLEFYDASFKRYGGGATEVRIFVNKA